MKEGIKTIIFDIGGVLWLGKQRIHKNQLHASGVHELAIKKLKTSVDQYFDSIDGVYAKSMEGKISKKKLLKTMSKNLKYPEKKLEKLYFKLYLKVFKKNKQLFKQAKKLRKLGYTVGILSDQWQLSKPAHAAKKDMRYFDPVIISCDAKLRKPSDKSFKQILKKAKSRPSETLFIDNQEWNTLAASKLGIKTIQFKNNKQLFKHPLWKKLFN